MQTWLERRLPGLPPVHGVVCFAGRSLVDERLRWHELDVCNLDELLDVLTQRTGEALTDVDQMRIGQLLKERMERW